MGENGGQRADAWRRGQSGLKAHKADTGRTGLEARPKRAQGRDKDTGHKAGTWRTHGGQGLEAAPYA